MTEPNQSPSFRRRSSLSEQLQIAANLAVVVAGAAVTWVALAPSPQRPSSPEPYRVGDVIDRVDGIDFTAASYTLIAVLREECRFCQASTPFYYKLASALAGQSVPLARLVVVTPDAAPSMAQFLQANQIQVDQIATFDPRTLRVPGTPFIILADSERRVRGVWRGQLTSTQELEVFTALGLETPQ